MVIEESVALRVSPGSPDHTRWLLLLLPLLLIVANSGWLYNTVNTIDPWVYLGYFLHLVEFKSTLFPNLYYGSRLPWILPGYVAYRFFDATVARYVLHLAFYYVALFSMYALLKSGFGRKNALLGTVVFGTHAGVLYSIGWDYVDGAGLTYNLLALACLSRATVVRSGWLWLVLAGMAGIAMFYTNLFLAVFIPLQLAFYLLLASTGFNRSLARSMARLLWYVAGAALLTAVLGAINYRLDGSYWFYAPSVGAFLALSAAPNASRLDTLTWIGQASWLVIPAAATVACIAHLIRNRQRGATNWGDYRTLFIWQYLASVALMVAWHSVGGLGLQTSFYTSYLFPSLFLAIGAILAVSEDGWPPYIWGPMVVGSVVALAFALRLFGGPLTRLLVDTGVGPMLVVTTAAFIGRALFSSTWQTIVPVLAGLVLYQVAYSGFFYPPSNRDSANRVTEAVRASWPHMQTGTAVFWYDITEPHGLEFSSINATYLWAYTFVSQKFPALDDVRSLRDGETALVLSGSGQAVERANQTLRERKLTGSLTETHHINGGGVAYDLSVLTIHDYLPNLQPLKAVPRGATADLIAAEAGDETRLPLSLWKAVSMEQRSEGVLVTTGKEQFAYGSWYGPLVAPGSGRYQFTLNYRLIEGRILVGGMTADMARGLGRAMMPPRTSGSHTVKYLVSLKAGEGVVLLVANDAVDIGARAKYLVESLSVAASLDDDTRQ